MRLRIGLAAGSLLAGQLMLAGDMSYEETTRITGGSVMSMMKFAGAFSKDARKLDQPVLTSISVKGNRMARASQDSAEIIDLDAETITRIDKLKQQYSVVTFAQMNEAMERAAEKAKAEQSKSQPKAADPNTQADSNAQNVELSFETHVRKTGATRQVSGLDTNEVILTLAMNGKDKTNGQQGALAVTNDMWMAPDLPGYAEVREFNRKFAVKMGSVMKAGPDLTALVQQAAASDAMKTLAKESADLQGVPVLQVMRMGMTVNGQPLPAASEAALPASSTGDNSGTLGSAISKSTGDVAQQTAAQETSSRVRGALGSSLGSAIGGFGGFGRKKKKDTAQDTPAQPPAAAGPSPAAGVLMESMTQVGKFSQQVDPAAMEVPAGYKLMPAPELKNMAQ